VVALTAWESLTPSLTCNGSISVRCVHPPAGDPGAVVTLETLARSDQTSVTAPPESTV
jgi:hypothetical protein